MTQVTLIPVGDLKMAADNIRSDVGDVTELAATIRSVGLLEPLLVQEDLTIVCGARRLAGAIAAGLTEVPVIVRSFTEQERVEAMLVENLQRDDLSPLEEAAGFMRLKQMGLTQTQIAERVGCSQGQVSKRLSLLELPEAVQEHLEAGKLKLEDAQELVKIAKDEPEKVVEMAAKQAKQKQGDYASERLATEVKQNLEAKARQKKYEADVAKRKKAGETVIPPEQLDDYGRVKLPDGLAFVRAQTYNRNEVEMDPAKHAKLACHGLFVHPHTLVETEVCTAPTQHPSPADKEKKERMAAAEQRRKEEEAWDLIVARRRQFVASKIASKPDKDLALDLCLLALTSGRSYYWEQTGDEALIACHLLDIDGPLGDEEDDLVAALEVNMKKSAADKVRTIAAIAAAKLDMPAGKRYRWDDDVVEYMQLLMKLGFDPSPEEKELYDDARGELADSLAEELAELTKEVAAK